MTSYRDPKGVSALRDDIAAFARFLLNLLEEKNAKLRSLVSNESAILSKLVSNDRDGAEDLLAENGDLIESVDLLNYDMAENRRSLSAILGCGIPSVDKILSEDDSDEGRKYKSLSDDTAAILTECIAKADEISALLQNELDETGKSIKACESIRRVKDLTGLSFNSQIDDF